MTPPPTIEQILWRTLSLDELRAAARAKGAMHTAIEYLAPASIARAIKECEQSERPASGLAFHRALAREVTLSMATTLIRLLGDAEHLEVRCA